ncbi:hypothetical protein [Arsenophonus sp.]|uniref:phage tail fiber protein n=1 Tax=Arsenophonus sp. TaxID=1872640 RepID=UPI00285A2855|nr:hypothetical protein [Arsenophonus sp.]MDR5615684.1 hypothetical protein [Arsenophonus sp.]MDR5616270.1 hypothetical protein [Arsenophonus sp.]MDR5616865.1 hypothetical protein [Arsenophonus sp.]
MSGSSIVKGAGTKWNSNNPLVSPGMLMLVKNGDINYPYMIKAVNSDTELVLAEEATFSATDTTYTINLTEPNNNSDAARALVAANTYILYFLQNMDTWMGDNGVVELTLPSGKTIKLESIKALQELVEGKADASSVKEIKDALESKADSNIVEEISKSVTEISKDLNNKLDKSNIVQAFGSATDKVMSQKASTDAFAKKDSTETLKSGRLNVESASGDTIFNLGGTNGSSGSEFAYVRSSKRTQIHDVGAKTTIQIPQKSGIMALTSDIPKMRADSNGFFKKASPIIKIYANGNFETNAESEGAIVQRLETGKYLICGVLGYNADGAWGVNGGVSIPKDINGLELIYVKDKVLAEGSIEIQTFHRQHSHLPEDFQNVRIKEIIDGKPVYYADGERVDIPPSTWLDVRVEMPVDSIWNQQHAQKE